VFEQRANVCMGSFLTRPTSVISREVKQRSTRLAGIGFVGYGGNNVSNFKLASNMSRTRYMDMNIKQGSVLMPLRCDDVVNGCCSTNSRLSPKLKDILQQAQLLQRDRARL